MTAIADSDPVPLWARAQTMARLFDMAESTFRDMVARKMLPCGVRLTNGITLYSVAATSKALDDLLRQASDGLAVDPVLAAIEGAPNGEKTKGRRHAA